MIAQGLDIARGVAGPFSHVHKFGENNDIDTGSDPETIWSAGGLYPWDSLSSAQTLYVLSDDANDTDDLVIQGLDEDYNLQTETVTLTGTTAVTTTNTFLRVFRMQYMDGGNEGVITARVTSASGTIVAQIDEEKSQTLMAVYTVPAGHRAYITGYTGSAEKAKDIKLEMYIREADQNNFQLKSQMHLFEATATQPFAVPIFVPQKSDIDFRGITQNSNAVATVNFDIILEKM